MARGAAPAPSPPRLDAAELAALRALEAAAAADPSTAHFPRSTLVRFLLSSKGNHEQALARLRKLHAKRLAWRMDELSEPLEAVEMTLDGRGRVHGYWRLGGPDHHGRQTAFIVQAEARPPAEYKHAISGLQAAHHFFNAVSSDFAVIRDGLTLVIDLTNVSVMALASTLSNSHLQAIGDGYSEIMPIRWQLAVVVGASMGVRPLLMAGALLKLQARMRERVHFAESYDELARFVPRRSWPVGMHADAAAVPLEQTSRAVRDRLAAFERECALLPGPTGSARVR